MTGYTESVTAKLCSFARAYHSNTSREKIFDDYLAFDLMGKEEYDKIGQLIENDYTEAFDPAKTFSAAVIRKNLSYISPIPLFRAASAENELMRFAAENGGCQYVICGAGMDTFSFRNDNENITVFELDHPDTQRYKKERIHSLEWTIPKNVHFVAADLSKDDMAEKLISAGFAPDKPSFFAILGVTYYLTLPVFGETLEKISALATPGSLAVFDFPDKGAFGDDAEKRIQTLSGIAADFGEPMTGGFSADELKKLLAEHDFKIYRHEAPEHIQQQYFTERSDGQAAYENIHFIIAQKGR